MSQKLKNIFHKNFTKYNKVVTCILVALSPMDQLGGVQCLASFVSHEVPRVPSYTTEQYNMLTQ